MSDPRVKKLASILVKQSLRVKKDETVLIASSTELSKPRDRPPGVWSHGMHERNLRNLYRLLQEKD